MDYENQLEHFSLRWNNFNDNMKSGFHDLLRREDFVDVTIAAEGKLIQAHKIVLSICSPYFRNIFKTNPCQHPVVFLTDVTHKELSGILQFMYLGEVNVQQEELGKFLKTAEALQIKGLTGEENETTNIPISTKDNIKREVEDESPDDENPIMGLPLKRSRNSSPNSSNKMTPSNIRVEIKTKNETYYDGADIIPKTEPRDFDLSDTECDKVGVREGSISKNDSFAHLLNNDAEIAKESTITAASTSTLGADIFNGLSSFQADSFTMADGNQGISFVMSPRMRPCLVYNNYLYIKDHVGLATAGQPKTIYWRCKDVNCKARCIQANFKFRLKRNAFHQHTPNVDRSYTPIHMDHAYDIIKFLK